MHAEVTSPNTLFSSSISFVMADLSSGICIIKQLLDDNGLCYPPQPSASVDNTNFGLDDYYRYHVKTKSNSNIVNYM